MRKKESATVVSTGMLLFLYKTEQRSGAFGSNSSTGLKCKQLDRDFLLLLLARRENTRSGSSVSECTFSDEAWKQVYRVEALINVILVDVK
jgi:hypothetical protein